MNEDTRDYLSIDLQAALAEGEFTHALLFDIPLSREVLAEVNRQWQAMKRVDPDWSQRSIVLGRRHVEL